MCKDERIEIHLVEKVQHNNNVSTSIPFVIKFQMLANTRNEKLMGIDNNCVN